MLEDKETSLVLICHVTSAFTVISRSLRESDLHVDLILNGRIGKVQPGQEGERESNT